MNESNVKQKIFAVLAGLLTLVTAGRTAVNRTETVASPIPPTLFGMHIHSMVIPRPYMHQPDPWPAVGFGSWRLWDAYVDWTHLEPERGKWTFDTLDKS